MVIKIANQKELFALGLIVYIFIFILPVFIYLKLNDKIDPLEFLKLNRNVRSGIVTGLLLSFLFLFTLLLKRIVLGQWISINFNIGILWISGLTVGIFEEIPFRGFILQKFMSRMHFITANLITSVLFTTIHLPIWILSGNNILDSIKGLLFISLILGHMFKESDSLWVPIICHSAFNLSIWLGIT